MPAARNLKGARDGNIFELSEHAFKVAKGAALRTLLYCARSLVREDRGTGIN